MTMTSGEHLVDNTSRTHLLLAHLELVGSLADASIWLGSRRLHIELGKDACLDGSAQAATMTAANLAVRASLSVTASIPNASARIVFGPCRGAFLADTLVELGVSLSAERDAAFVLAIGDVSAELDNDGPLLQITWDGWVAGLRPAGVRMPEREGCVLAPIAAGALGVAEAFHHFLGHLDAGWRTVSISLWDPLAARPEEATGPSLSHLPSEWMLVGLGHLGQAYSWCLGYLPYNDGQGTVWLVDDDHASAANVSTGVVTRPSDANPTPHLKTRLVCRWLERVGFNTRLLEWRLPDSYRWQPGDPGVALIGVDNFRFRRSLSTKSWPLCIDAGLGSTASSFASMSLHAFPGEAHSSEVVAWSEGIATNSATPPALAVLEGTTTDQCGVVMLAGQAVAAAFVGTIAACFAVAEPLRRIADGPSLDALTLSLDLPLPRAAPAPVKRPLRVAIVPAAKT